MTEIEETSKAIGEVAKLGTKALDSGDKLGGFLSKVLGYPIEEAVGIVGDTLKYKRWQRQIRMVDEVNKLLREKDIDETRPIPPKFAIPMLEQASLEEDDDLQDIWCTLITNSLDPDFDSEIRYAYIEIVKSLTSLDAKILKLVYEEVSKTSDLTMTEMSNIKVQAETINRHVDSTEEELAISLNNLMRVQCLRNPSLENAIHVNNQGGMTFQFTNHGQMYISLNPLGMAFIRTCME